jgi:hypothetical protein
MRKPRDLTTKVAVVFTMTENHLTDREYIEARRLDALETSLVREGKALCGRCSEPIHPHGGQIWVDDRDRHYCRGTTFNHFPRDLSSFSLMPEDRPPIAAWFPHFPFRPVFVAQRGKRITTRWLE